MEVNPHNDDERLNRLLKEWRSEAPLPVQFQESVWRRIEQAQARLRPSLWAVLARWFSTKFGRPALALSYLSVLLAVGLTAGWAQAHQDTARVKGELRARYVQTVDPYQVPHETAR